MTKPTTFVLQSGVEMELNVTTIGTTNVEGGANAYLLIQRLDDVLSINQAREYIADRFYFESPGAGSAFCNSCSLVHQQYSDSVVIATVHQRYDI